MFTFIVIILLAVPGVVLVAKRRVAWEETDVHDRPTGNQGSHPTWPYGAALLTLALILAAFAFTAQVPAKNVGVVTTFGKVSDRNLGAGLHFIWPWQKVTTLDATIITDKFVGEQNGENGRSDLDCISVRIQDGTTACVSMVIRSQIDPSKANDLYANYRSDDVDGAIFDALIRTQLTAAANEVFRDFDPVLTGSGTKVNTSAPNLQALSGEVLDVMTRNLTEASSTSEPEVNMVALTVSYIAFSETTEERINDLQAEVAKTRVAQQQEATAQAQAKANRLLASSVSKDPNVLVSKCFDIFNSMVQAGQPIPAGFTCWPSSNSGTLVFGPGASKS
jgi:regulator of protease activity HflC (stomatin/prohibitin superfamily)